MRPDFDDVRWLGEAREHDQIALRVGVAGDLLVAEWVGRARFSVRRDGTNAELVGVQGADPREVEKLRNGAARLLVHHLRGKIGLHGSSVVVDGRALVFIGKSGQGKSTLSASLCRQAKASLTSDDAVALDRTSAGWIAKPLESEHWLDADARRATIGDASSDTAKIPIRAPRVTSGDAPLAMIAELVFADIPGPRLVVQKGLSAVAAILPLVVRFVLDDPGLHRTELDQLHDLVAHVPVVRLERPRDLGLLSETNALIMAALERGDLR